MGIISVPVIDNSLEGKKARQKALLDKQRSADFVQLVSAFKRQFDTVWNNSMGLSAQDIFDAYGSDAALLFDAANKTQNFINSLVPNTINLVPPLQYTINQDGTVTVPPAS